MDCFATGQLSAVDAPGRNAPDFLLHISVSNSSIQPRGFSSLAFGRRLFPIPPSLLNLSNQIPLGFSSPLFAFPLARSTKNDDGPNL